MATTSNKRPEPPRSQRWQRFTMTPRMALVVTAVLVTITGWAYTNSNVPQAADMMVEHRAHEAAAGYKMATYYTPARQAAPQAAPQLLSERRFQVRQGCLITQRKVDGEWGTAELVVVALGVWLPAEAGVRTEPGELIGWAQSRELPASHRLGWRQKLTVAVSPECEQFASALYFVRPEGNFEQRLQQWQDFGK